MSHLLDVPAAGSPFAATVRYTGRRQGVTGRATTRDAFSHSERLDEVLPGSGPIAITSRFRDLAPGKWSVRADLIAGRSRQAALPAATWSWRRWAPIATPEATFSTRSSIFAPLAYGPAALPGIYPALALLGFAVALATQASILTTRGLDAGPPFAASLVALAIGVLAARLWFAALHHGALLVRGGWAVDGFLLVAPLTGVLLLHLLGQPIGAVLDASTPGIFLAVAIGRVGCFLAGCCAGRGSGARFAIWSSDQRLGMRRVPAQLLESGSGLVIGTIALVLVALQAVSVPGVTFLFGAASYAVIRQLLLRLRAERRESRRSLPLTALANTGVLALVMTAVTLHGG